MKGKTQLQAKRTARTSPRALAFLPLLTAAALALAGTALTGFSRAGALAPPPGTPLTARRMPVPQLVEEGEKLAESGQIKRALAAFAEAQTLRSLGEIPGASRLCKEAHINGIVILAGCRRRRFLASESLETGLKNAPEVLSPCDLAVAKAPEAGDFRDSRGVARALTGDRDGAIADFQAFVNSTKDEFRKSQRQAWINTLRRGENPFTPEQLKQMFRESGEPGFGD